MGSLTVIEAKPGALTAGRAPTNPAAVYLSGLAPTGRYSMMRTLDRIAAMLGHSWQTMPWADLRYEHVQAIRTKLAEIYKPGTVNTALCGLRRVAQESWRLGLMDSEDYRRIADVPSVTGHTLPAGRAIGSGELGAMMRVCMEDPTPAGARDAAIISIAYGAGLRRAELAGLDQADVVADDGEGFTLKVTGRRNKERLVYLNNGAALALADWLTVLGDEPGALFWSGRKGGHLIVGQRMTGQAIRDMLNRRASRT